MEDEVRWSLSLPENLSDRFAFFLICVHLRYLRMSSPGFLLEFAILPGRGVSLAVGDGLC